MTRPRTLPWLIALLVAAVALACWSSTPPAAVGTDAAPTRFSAIRAMATVAFAGARAHPTGTPAAAAVRDGLVVRMQALGLRVTRRREVGVGFSADDRMPTAQAGEVETLIGVLPGTDPTPPAVALMAHTDSVPDSFGAADDGAGLAVALETVRAIAAGPRPVRDVMLILTDGEEAGLLGARGVFADPRFTSRIGAIVNVDSRGTSGLGAMFETGPGSGGLVALYRREATNRFAHSAATFLYRQLPNRTDLTAASGLDIPALNFAFLDGEFDYHTPRDRVASLDPRTLQSLGDQILPVIRAVASEATLPERGDDGVFGDSPGIVALRYPAWVGWPLLGLAALLAGWGVRGAKPAASARMAAATLWIGLAAALAARAGYALTGVGEDWAEHHRIMARFGRYEVALALTGLAVLLAGAGAVRHGRWQRASVAGVVVAGALAAILGRPLAPTAALAAAAVLAALLAFGHPIAARERRAGTLAVGLILSLTLQAIAPALTPLLLWPTLAASIAAAFARRWPEAGWAEAIVVLLPLAYLLVFAHAVLLALGIVTPEAVGLFALVAALLVLPLAGRHAGTLAVGCAALAAVLLLSFRWAAPTERHPILSQVYGVVDERGRSWRVSPLERPDAWTRAALAADGGAITRATMPMIARTPVWRAPAHAIGARPPAIRARRRGDDMLLSIAPVSGGRELRITLVTDRPLAAVRFAGRPLGTFGGRPGTWRVRWRGTSPARLHLRAPRGTVLRIAAAETSPPRLAPPSRPANVVPWLGSDRTVAIGTATLRY